MLTENGARRTISSGPDACLVRMGPRKLVRRRPWRSGPGSAPRRPRRLRSRSSPGRVPERPARGDKRTAISARPAGGGIQQGGYPCRLPICRGRPTTPERSPGAAPRPEAGFYAGSCIRTSGNADPATFGDDVRQIGVRRAPVGVAWWACLGRYRSLRQRYSRTRPQWPSSARTCSSGMTPRTSRGLGLLWGPKVVASDGAPEGPVEQDMRCGPCRGPYSYRDFLPARPLRPHSALGPFSKSSTARDHGDLKPFGKTRVVRNRPALRQVEVRDERHAISPAQVIHLTLNGFLPVRTSRGNATEHVLPSCGRSEVRGADRGVSLGLSGNEGRTTSPAAHELGPAQIGPYRAAGARPRAGTSAPEAAVCCRDRAGLRPDYRGFHRGFIVRG